MTRKFLFVLGLVVAAVVVCFLSSGGDEKEEFVEKSERRVRFLAGERDEEIPGGHRTRFVETGKPEVFRRGTALSERKERFVQPATRAYVPVEVTQEEIAALRKVELDEKARAWKWARENGELVKGTLGIEGTGVFELMSLDDEGRPVYYGTDNDDSAISNGVNLIREMSPYNLSGEGWWVGVWDSGNVRNSHIGFAGSGDFPRAILYEVSVATDVIDVDSHATHVAGTIAGNGAQVAGGKFHAGMAPKAILASFDWDSDVTELMERGVGDVSNFESYQLFASNHSYGALAGWKYVKKDKRYRWYGQDGGTESDFFGRYDFEAHSFDEVVRKRPYLLPIKSAGNNRGGIPQDGIEVSYRNTDQSWVTGEWEDVRHLVPGANGSQEDGYDTIPTYGVAKNVLTVGNTIDSNAPFVANLPVSSSSFGPADDGRFKPDVVANGFEVWSTDSGSDFGYSPKTGTSMAAPSVTGAAVLLQELYHRETGEYLFASSMKALLIHTAKDLMKTGPDYATGYGLVNAKAAADHILDHVNDAEAGRILEDEVTNAAKTKAYGFRWDGSGSLKATLCWTDWEGAAQAGLDNRAKNLIHDLDLKLVSPSGLEFLPYKGNVNDPAAAATIGVNEVDNAEQVLVDVDTPEEGVWTLKVSLNGMLNPSATNQIFSVMLDNGVDFGDFEKGVDSASLGARDYLFGGDGEWIYDGLRGVSEGDAARSGSVGDNESSWVETEVRGPASLNFWWRTDSEAGFDFLRLMVDGNVVASKSGEDGDFSEVTYAIPSGRHTVRWVYEKDGSRSLGGDGGWVDAIRVFPNEIAEAVDNAELTFDGLPSGSATSWTKVIESGRRDDDAAQSGAAGPNESSIFSTTIPGPAILSFDWKVSSEEGFDKLIFARTGGAAIEEISGEKSWRKVTVELPDASNVVEWRYQKDGSRIGGMDRGWVDDIFVVPADFRIAQGMNLERADGGSDFPLSMRSQFLMAWRGGSDESAPSGDGNVALVGPASESLKNATLESAITGPGVLTFWWRMSGDRNITLSSNDEMRFWVGLTDPNTGIQSGTVASESISGVQAWQQVILEIPEGDYEMNWELSSGGASLPGPVEGAIDGFTFTPGTGNTSYQIAEGPIFPQVDGVEPLYTGIDNWGRPGEDVGAGQIAERWSTGGEAHWHSFRDESNGGRDSATHGPVENDGSAWMEMEVFGPRILFFDWKVSSELNWDKLHFLIDGEDAVSPISGEVPWTQVRHEIPPGRHVLRWEYAKDGSRLEGADQGWVDGIALMGRDFGSFKVEPDEVLEHRRWISFRADVYYDRFSGWSARSGYVVEFSEDLKNWTVVYSDLPGSRSGLTRVSHDFAGSQGMYRLGWQPERAVTLTNSGFEDVALNEGSFTFAVPGWKEGNDANSFVENFRTITAGDGENTLGMNAGTVLESDHLFIRETRGVVTLDVMVGNRESWTNSGNRSVYGLTSNDTREFNASTIPVGTFEWAPSMRWEPKSFDSSFSGPVYLEAGGTGRSHFDRVRVWVENR